MATVDYFLKLDGVDGESTQMKGHIDILSWSWGVTNSGSFGKGGGGGSGASTAHDAQFTMHTSTASAPLFAACASGKHFATATLVCRKAGDKPLEYLKIKLSKVLVSSFQTGGSAGDVIPVDSVSLNFAKVEIEYKAQTEKGAAGASPTATWDFSEGHA
jgi:type VI secretion system secreted protein Hcp